MNQKSLRVLVCPLDWGLGHATRCIPIIRHLINSGADVYIASDGQSSELLKQEFPHLKHLFLHGYKIDFKKSRSISINLLTIIPRLIARVIAEHKQLDQFVKSNEIDVVISDNRYGLWHKKAYCVFITHQPNILPPDKIAFLSPVGRLLTRYFMRKYDECWIPDEAGDDNLSGNLSHGYSLPNNTSYIGLLSRFDMAINSSNRTYDIIAIISGPEPYRSQLENILTSTLANLKYKSLLLQGKAGSKPTRATTGNLEIVNHLPSEELGIILKSGPTVICRGGYSTLMDLAILGNKVICIPTPGQTEQEYLASIGHSNNKLVCIHQESLFLEDAIASVEKTSGLKSKYSNKGYLHAIDRLLAKINSYQN